MDRDVWDHITGKADVPTDCMVKSANDDKICVQYVGGAFLPIVLLTVTEPLPGAIFNVALHSIELGVVCAGLLSDEEQRHPAVG